MTTDQLRFLKEITKESTNKRELNLISDKLKSVKLTGIQDIRFNITMDIRSILINKL